MWPAPSREKAIWPAPLASVTKICMPATMRLSMPLHRAQADPTVRMFPEQDVVLEVDRLLGRDLDGQHRHQLARDVVGDAGEGLVADAGRQQARHGGQGRVSRGASGRRGGGPACGVGSRRRAVEGTLAEEEGGAPRTGGGPKGARSRRGRQGAGKPRAAIARRLWPCGPALAAASPRAGGTLPSAHGRGRCLPMKAVFTHKAGSVYDDLPEERYHFPRDYLRQAEAAVGDFIVYYEPGRTGLDERARTGRRAYGATARVAENPAGPAGPRPLLRPDRAGLVRRVRPARALPRG